MAMISDKLNKILSAIFGKDVRQALHDGLKAINDETENTTAKQGHLEDTFDQLVINAGNSNAEIVDARVDKNTGVSYSKVGDRLDAHSSQLENKAKYEDLDEVVNFLNDSLNCKNDKISITEFTPPNFITLHEDVNEVITFTNEYTGRSGLPLSASYSTINSYVVKEMLNYVMIGYKDKTKYVVVEFNSLIIGRVYLVDEVGNFTLLREHDNSYGVIKIGDNITCEKENSNINFYINGNKIFELPTTILPADVPFRLGFTAEVNNITGLKEPICRKLRNGKYFKFNTFNFNKENRYLGKILTCLGDSITQGTGLLEDEKTYHAILKERLGFSVINNLGVHGTEISTGGTWGAGTSFCDRYVNIPSDSDYIFVFGGTNDYLHGVPLGDKNSKDKSNFYGALDFLLSKLYETYYNARIIFITPIRTYDTITGNTDIANNTAGHNLTDYVNAMKEVCAKHSTPVIDLHTTTGFVMDNWRVREKYTTDGIHPNQTGHIRMADVIEGDLQAI